MAIRKYRESLISNVLHKKASVSRIPLSGTFELTPVCNLNCKMCYIRKSEEERKAIGPLRSADEWIAAGKEARDLGMLYILLTGGEPFLHPEFEKILAGLHELGLVISINTNGTLIDDERIELLKKYPPSRVNITLYGASNTTYRDLCGVQGMFDRVKEAILTLKQNKIPVVINLSLTPYNQNDLEEILDFSVEHEIPIKTSTYMFPPVRKNAFIFGTNDRLSPEDAALCTARIERYFTGDEKYVNSVMNAENIVFPVDTADDCLDETEQKGNGIRCRAGKCAFWVTWQGDMSMCGMIPPQQGFSNIFTDSFLNCWVSVKNSSDQIHLPARCEGCVLRDQCRPCAAICYTETGSYDRVPEYRCRMAHAYPAMSKQLALSILEKSE